MDNLSARTNTLLTSQRARKSQIVLTPRRGATDSLVQNVLRLLVQEGYIETWSRSYSKPASPSWARFHSTFIPTKQAAYTQSAATFDNLTIRLKYGPRGEPAFQTRFRISTPGRRVHLQSSALWQPLSTTGTLIISTSQGLRTDREARLRNLGGEVLIGIRLSLKLQWSPFFCPQMLQFLSPLVF